MLYFENMHLNPEENYSSCLIYDFHYSYTVVYYTHTLYVHTHEVFETKKSSFRLPEPNAKKIWCVKK